MIRVVVYRIALWACLMGAAGSAWSEGAEGAAASKPLSERWIPAFSGTLIVVEDEMKGKIDSTIGFSDAGSIGETVARFQLGLELMTPSLRVLPAGPRVVGFAGLQLMGPNEENEAAGAGDTPNLSSVEEQVERALDPSIPGNFPPPESFNNQGSELTTTRQDAGWFVGIGLVFEFPDRKEQDPGLRLRPFVTYVGELIDLDGQSLIVEGQPCCVPTVGSYTIRHGAVSKEKTLHYLGPGLDVELVVASFEKTTLSLFGRVSFLWNVGDSSFTLSDGSGLGRYHYEVDDFTIRPGGGLRVAWRGGI